MNGATPLILVVDDDGRIRDATASALEDLGYATISANDGADGLQRIINDPAITLVVTDVLMPNLSGPEMVAAAKQSRPNLPIVFMSGDTGCYEEPDFAGHPLLCKPFTLPALADAVEAALAIQNTAIA